MVWGRFLPLNFLEWDTPPKVSPVGRCCLWLCLCPVRPNFFNFRDRYCPLAGQLAPAAATAATATTAPRPAQQLVLGTVIAQQPLHNCNSCNHNRNRNNNHANNAQQQRATTTTATRNDCSTCATIRIWHSLPGPCASKLAQVPGAALLAAARTP